MVTTTHSTSGAPPLQRQLHLQHIFSFFYVATYYSITTDFLVSRSALGDYESVNLVYLTDYTQTDNCFGPPQLTLYDANMDTFYIKFFAD